MGKPRGDVDHWSVSCPRCGSPKGQPCENGRNEKLAHSHAHNPRVRAAVAAHNQAAVDEAVALVDSNGFSTVPNELGVTASEEYQAQEVAALDAQEAVLVREAKIGQILFGIGLARKMGMTQRQLDRRLAEMIADGEN